MCAIGRFSWDLRKTLTKLSLDGGTTKDLTIYLTYLMPNSQINLYGCSSEYGPKNTLATCDAGDPWGSHGQYHRIKHGISWGSLTDA